MNLKKIKKELGFDFWFVVSFNNLWREVF